MFLQPIVLDKRGFRVRVGCWEHFPLHWHSDLEVLYCNKGGFTVEHDEEKFHISAGDAILIGSCVPHSVDADPDTEGYVISLGYHLFGDDFDYIRSLQFSPPYLKCSLEMREEIGRIVELRLRGDGLSDDLELRGRIYRLISLLLRGLPVAKKVSKGHQDRLYAITKIQRALDFVAAHYSENLSLEQVAALSGYEKSSFCRSFKNATNTTFHKYLNSYRINMAKVLLTESDESISQISSRVGFTQHKNFCRLFKEIHSLSPSDYRKKYR